jgi:hypothetical protein
MLSPVNSANPNEAATVVVPDNVPLPGLLPMARAIDADELKRRLFEPTTCTAVEKVFGNVVLEGEIVKTRPVAVAVVPSSSLVKTISVISPRPIPPKYGEMIGLLANNKKGSISFFIAYEILLGGG